MRNAVFLLAVLLVVHRTLCHPHFGRIMAGHLLSAPVAEAHLGKGLRFLSPYGFGMGMPLLPPRMPYVSPYMSGYCLPYQMPVPTYAPGVYNMASPVLPSYANLYPVEAHAVAGGF